MKIDKVILRGLLLLLLPIAVWGQSEVTRRVSAAEAGYRGRVHTVQCTEFCMDSDKRFFVTRAEAYNEQGLRTDMSVADFLYQTNYHYEYDDNGQSVYYLGTYAEGGKDSIVFHYDKSGCLFGFEEYFLSADPTEGNSITDFLITCDTQCRVLRSASVWEDTTLYEYDDKGRLTQKTMPGHPNKTVTYHYDNDGRLVKKRFGDKHYEDTHYRYDANGDTLEVWHTNWEHHEGEQGGHEVGEHKYYSYTKYDDHGNWTNATVTVERPTYTYTLIRTFGYYE